MIKEFFILLLMSVCFFVSGILVDEAYRAYSAGGFQGIWLSSGGDQVNVLEAAYRYDSYGDWVCVNIKNKDFSDIVDICEHEAGHELFARMYAKDSKIVEKFARLENGTG